MLNSQPDILIVGAGVTGLTTAFELAREGLQVIVCDRQSAGQEASWAGAGMLPPGAVPNANSPEARLRSFSNSLWPQLATSLQQITGRDVGYRVSGSLLLMPDCKSAESAAGQWLAEGAQALPVTGPKLRNLCPSLHSSHDAALWLPQQAQVRNPWHLQALKLACEQLHVQFLENTTGPKFEITGSTVHSVTINNLRLQPSRVCITAGAWTANILEQAGVRLPIFPVRGQIAQLKTTTPLLNCMLEHGKRYLVPRTDGLILVGSTEELTGFQKANTAQGVSDLLEFACSLVPKLRGQELVRCWSGLRPGSADELPFLGRAPGFQNLFVAAGHFRSGLQMSPGTAKIMAHLLQDQTPPISLQGLEASRSAVSPGQKDQLPCEQ
jgi:glycine oxidase